MERRKFLRNTALASISIPFMFKNWSYAAVTDKLFSISRGAQDKVLVLIRLNGGNDGLNTVIPMDYYSNLVKQRANIIIPENKLINITPKNALHPAMTGMANMFQNGNLSIVQNVGYPEQNRSHFRSMDIWTSGSLDVSTTTGWLGRHLDKAHPGFPEAYPDADNPDPFAISMGYEVSATCQGLMSNFSHTVVNPSSYFSSSSSSSANDGTYYGSHMEFLSTIIAQTNKYGQRVYDATKNVKNLSTKYDDKNDLATQLKYVAQMIRGGLKTNVYVVNINGFDNHDSQVITTDVTTGKHADLLKSLSDAIAAFQDDLTLMGIEKRVAGMTFSEFGRQIASNASNGTDHGDAAPLFLFGSCLSQPIYGANPTISDQVIDQAGVPMQVDFRDVYASLLKDWFEVPSDEIQSMFSHTITYHSLMGACTLSIEDNPFNAQKTIVYPNPASQHITLRLTTHNEQVKISIVDLQGKEQGVFYDATFTNQTHELPISISELALGNYIIHIQKASGNETISFTKVKEN
jgi:uncharacterized protein (DUF1501 family)